MATLLSIRETLSKHVGGQWHPRGTEQGAESIGVSPSYTLTDPLDHITGFYSDAKPTRVITQLADTLSERYNITATVEEQGNGHASLSLPLSSAMALTSSAALKSDTQIMRNLSPVPLLEQIYQAQGLQAERAR